MQPNFSFLGLVSLKLLLEVISANANMKTCDPNHTQ